MAAALLVVLAVALIADAFARSPIPPGVDPGHWLAISYSYVGLPTAPDPTDRALFYPPLLFPLLGALVLAFGPLVAAAVLAVGLFAAYGATVVHVARRYLVSGPFQLALVGLAMFSGPTLQMVFWGGYPNLLGFILMDEAFIFLLLWVQVRRPVDGSLLYVFVALTYFAHDLSFLVLVLSLGTAAVYLVAVGKVPIRFLANRVNLIGMAAVIALVGGYVELTSHLGISHPSYLGANPSAYFIDQVGELFIPLAHDPILPPQGVALFLPSYALSLVLVAAPLVALAALVGVRRRNPSMVDSRILIVAAWFSMALALPGLGYLAHVPTDYPRFLYFLPLPFFVLILVTLDSATVGWWTDTPSALPVPAPPGVIERLRARRRRFIPARVAAVLAAVGVLLVVVFASVAVPVVLKNEAAGTATAHDSQFLAAMAWLNAQPNRGSVLTVASAARWTEALSARTAYTVGPEWLLFDQFQIADTQESYWALTSQYAVANNQVAFSFSGFTTPVFSQAPMYVPFVEGVEFPVLRVLPGSLLVEVHGPAGNGSFPLEGNQSPEITLDPSGAATITASYQSTVAGLTEIATARPGGTSGVQFVIAPAPGEIVRSFSLELAPPPSDSSVLATNSPAGIHLEGDKLLWNVTGQLGQYPNRVTVASQATFDPAPVSARNPNQSLPNAWNLTFADPNRSGPFEVDMELTTTGTSNPSTLLPRQFSTAEFLAGHSVEYLLWPPAGKGAAELAYFGSAFGFQLAYESPQWDILERP